MMTYDMFVVLVAQNYYNPPGHVIDYSVCEFIVIQMYIVSDYIESSDTLCIRNFDIQGHGQSTSTIVAKQYIFLLSSYNVIS